MKRKAVEETSGQSVQVAFVDPSYTGDDAAQAAEKEVIQLEVVEIAQG